MKTLRKTILSLAFVLAGISISKVSADPPSDPPPPPGGGHGSGSNQAPAGAPIDGGLGILFVLGTAFAGIKHYKNRIGARGGR
jgi:hypothetical protein